MLSRSVVSNSATPWTVSSTGSSVHGDSPGKNTGVGCHALLQGIFSTQGWNPSFLHCRQIHYHLSYQRSPTSVMNVKVAQSCPTFCGPMDYRVHRILQARILEWVAFPFSPGDFLNPGYKKHTLKIRAGKIENKRIEKYKPCKW